MSNAPTTQKHPAHLEALLQQLDPSPTGRLLFGVDVTASRQPTWDMATGLTARMFEAAAANGGLEMQLVYYRGDGECVASRWMSDARALTTAMSAVTCRAGPTQIGRVLNHVRAENARKNVAAAILISDACEENPSDLYAIARGLGVPIFLFQEGADQTVAGIYSELAAITGGAGARFDTGAAAKLADLLRAVAAFATGGRKALALEKTAAARLLLTQLK